MLQLYFVRHGQTDYNLKGIVQGGGIDSDLNATGRSQAQAFFQAHREQKFDHVYVSELKRTHQTLAPWRAAGHQLHITPALNEFGWGIHEGKAPTKDQHDGFLQMIEQWKAGQLDAKVEAGESPNEAWARARDFFANLHVHHAPGAKILLCSHGRQLRVLLSNLMGIGMQNMEPYSHKNTGLSIVNLSPEGKGELISFNDTSHLEHLENVSI
ncbi:MAG: histidine phosphatase family protein [Bacteroidota bacterium]